MAKVAQRAAARRDLVQHFVYLAESADLDTAERFFANARATFEALAEQPLIGVALTPSNPRLAGLRKWRIRGFETFLVFYLPRPNGISVVRVLNAAQDWWSRLGISDE